jgi:hypothetical protein
MSNTTWTEIEKGAEVKVDGVPGAFVFISIASNGDITVFGGSKDPAGVRMFRTFRSERVRLYRPRVEHRRFQPSPAIPPTNRKGRR